MSIQCLAEGQLFPDVVESIIFSSFIQQFGGFIDKSSIIWGIHYAMFTSYGSDHIFHLKLVFTIHVNTQLQMGFLYFSKHPGLSSLALCDMEGCENQTNMGVSCQQHHEHWIKLHFLLWLLPPFKSRHPSWIRWVMLSHYHSSDVFDDVHLRYIITHLNVTNQSKSCSFLDW